MLFKYKSIDAQGANKEGEISIENAYQYSLNPKGLERLI